MVGCRATRPEDPRTARAEAFARVESWDEAAGLWNEIYIASGAKDIDAGVMSARALLEAGRADSARARLVDVAGRAPRRAEVFELLGLAHEELGEVAAAMRNYEIVTGLAPGSPLALRRFGDLLCAAGERERGLSLLRRSLAADPEDPETQLAFGLRAAESGLLDEAAPVLDRILDSPRATASERLAAARAFGPDPRVVPWLESVVVESPESSEALRRLGEARFVGGEEAEGLLLLERAARSDPGDVEALASFARALIASGELNSARAVVDHATGLELTPFESGLMGDVQRVLDEAAAALPAPGERAAGDGS